MSQSEFLRNLSLMSTEEQEYALRGMPFHLASIEEWDDLQIVLSSLDFIHEKVVRGMAYNVVGDYQFAMNRLKDAPNHEKTKYFIEEFSRAFNQELINFQDHPELTTQQIFNNLYSYYGFDGPIGLLLKDFLDQDGYPNTGIWLRQFNMTPKTSSPRELLRILSGHTGAVRTVCISNDGEVIVSGGLDGKIIAWKWDDGSILSSFDAHRDGVIAMDWYSNDQEEKRVVSLGGDQFIRIWDWTSGKKIGELNVEIEGINSMVVLKSVQQACLCGDDGFIRIWDLQSGQEVSLLGRHLGRALYLATVNEDSILVSCGEDLTLRLWRLGSTINTQRFYGHMGLIRAVAIDSGGEWITSAGDDMTVRIWEPEANKTPVVLHGHDQSIRCIAIIVDRNDIPLIISGSDDETIKVWDKINGHLIKTLKANKYGVNALAVDPIGRYFVSAGEDGTIMIWNAALEPVPDSWAEHEAPIHGLFSTQEWVASASADKTVRLWNVANGVHNFNVRSHLDVVNDVKIVDNKILSCGQDGLIKLHDLETGKFLGNLNRTLGQQIVEHQMKGNSRLGLEGHTGSVNCIYPISKRGILSGGSDGTVRLWDLDSGQEELTFQGATGGIELLLFSQKHFAVIAAGVGREISIWSVKNEIQVTHLSGHTSSVTTLCLTKDEQLVSGSRDGTIRLWDISAKSEVKCFSGHEHWVLCACAWEDYIFSGGDDKIIRIWDMHSGKQIRALTGHTAAVRLTVVDPKMDRLFTSGDDRRLNIWGLKNGDLQASIYTNSLISHLVVIDSHKICVGTQAGGVIFLSIEND